MVASSTSFTNIYKKEYGTTVAYILGFSNNLGIAEDCVQEAFEAAFSNWKRNAIPKNPGAWVRLAAKRRFIDMARSSKSYNDALGRIEHLSEEDVTNEMLDESALVKDDDLKLIFLCCHPAIKPTDQVMLTLRIVAGLKPKDIAAAFFADEQAIRTRLLRAKRKIKDAKIPVIIPTDEIVKDRLPQVLAAIYLIFNEGYLSTRGKSAGQPDLVKESRRLMFHLSDLLPNNAEINGVLALIFFTEARSNARITQENILVSLDEQDRSLWDKEKIEKGLFFLTRANKLKGLGCYECQAAIAAEHCKAENSKSTDWGCIVRFYDKLLAIKSTPVYRLNRCIALSFKHSPSYALEELESIEHEHNFKDQYSILATKADFHRRLGNKTEAINNYKLLLPKIDNSAIHEFISKRILEVLDT